MNQKSILFLDRFVSSSYTLYMTDETILEVKNLCKSYKTTDAVSDVSFTVKKGEIVGLLGPNGAGKTTIINMILGVLEPTAGKIEILGRNTKNCRSETCQSINFAAVHSSLPGNLTIRQNLYVFGMLYQVPRLKDKINALLEEFDLKGFSTTKAGLLSSGERTRLNIAKAVINEPSVLLLDEPTASLDPSAAQIVRENIQKYVERTQAGILWTSHNMQEIETVCDRVLFLSHGKIILEGNPKTLPGEHGKKDLEELFIAVAREPLSLDI